jgi:hypothetical protein
MAEHHPQSEPAASDIDRPINDVALGGLTPAVETIQAFAREIAQTSEQARDRTTRHIEELRKAQSMQDAAAIQADFLKEAMEHAVQHTREFILMLATYPHEQVRPVNVAVEAAAAARIASAAKVERLSEVAHKASHKT